MDLTTNSVVITGAIKFVQTNKEKLTRSTKEENNGKEPDYDDDREQQEEFRLFYDLLLVDIHMPKMDGFEFAAKYQSKISMSELVLSQQQKQMPML